MKFLKWTLIGFLWIMFFILLPENPRTNAEQNKEKNVRFHWAFGAIVGPENDRRLVAITRDTTLKTGDRLKMLVELQNRCFVYLIYKTGKDEIKLLFPYNLELFNMDYKILKKYYIPKGDTWFELDERVGIEMFYLLASAKRLTTLETLVERYELADAVHRQDLAKQILTEIRKIKKRHRQFSAVAERPIAIGGVVRGTTTSLATGSFDIDPIADNVSATNFYGRTFTIDHQ